MQLLHQNILPQITRIYTEKTKNQYSRFNSTDCRWRFAPFICEINPLKILWHAGRQGLCENLCNLWQDKSNNDCVITKYWHIC